MCLAGAGPGRGRCRGAAAARRDRCPVRRPRRAVRERTPRRTGRRRPPRRGSQDRVPGAPPEVVRDPLFHAPQDSPGRLPRLALPTARALERRRMDAAGLARPRPGGLAPCALERTLRTRPAPTPRGRMDPATHRGRVGGDPRPRPADREEGVGSYLHLVRRRARSGATTHPRALGAAELHLHPETIRLLGGGRLRVPGGAGMADEPRTRKPWDGTRDASVLHPDSLVPSQPGAGDRPVALEPRRTGRLGARERGRPRGRGLGGAAGGPPRTPRPCLHLVARRTPLVVESGRAPLPASLSPPGPPRGPARGGPGATARRLPPSPARLPVAGRTPGLRPYVQTGLLPRGRRPTGSDRRRSRPRHPGAPPSRPVLSGPARGGPPSETRFTHHGGRAALPP